MHFKFKSPISNYLRRLVGKSKSVIGTNNKYSSRIGKDNMFIFSNFESINAYLIKRVLVNQKFNLWINVKDKEKDAFYKPVLTELLIGLFKINYSNNKIINPEIGDKYQKGNKRYEVIETGLFISGNEAIKLECISRGHETTVTIALDFFYGDYTRIDDESGASNRRTFKHMLDFINETIGIRHSFSSFQNKFAVVCSKKHFEENFTLDERKAFPYEYITKNEGIQPNLPLDDFMFYVAPDYETIEECVLDNDIELDFVVFFGNKEDQVQQDINRGLVKQVIFVGSQRPEINNILEWRWTLPEIQYFNEKIDKAIKQPIVVNNEKFNDISRRFLDYINRIEKKYSINLTSINLYVSYLYPIVILSDESRLVNRIEHIAYSFEKRLEKVLINEFSAIGIDHTQTFIELQDIYLEALSQVNYANNLKSRHLEELLKNTEYLLIPSKQTLDIWKQEIKKINGMVKVINLNIFRGLKGQSNVKVLALEDKEFFQEVYSSIHNVQWLLYDYEYENYKKFQIRYDNALIEEYKSKDREKLSGVEYPDEQKEETEESLIDRLFDKGFTEIDREHEHNYHDQIFKEILFLDNTIITLSANSSVILINNKNKLVNNKVGDLRVGDKVRVYENHHKEILFDSIVESDEHGKFQKILQDSEKWKGILQEYCINNVGLEEVASRCGVVTSTVEGWFKPCSTTKFPQNIDKVRDLLGEDYFQIYRSNKVYKSIMIAAGRDLSDEISDYVINGVKGSLLSKFNADIIDAISRHNMPIRKIKGIRIVDIEA